MSILKTIGDVTHGYTPEFQGAVFLNDPSVAYDSLDEVLPVGWYPENAENEWTDIAVKDDKYFAVFGEDSVMVSQAKIIYVEIEPTSGMVESYNYIKQY